MKDLLALKRISIVYGCIVAMLVGLIAYTPLRSFGPLQIEEAAQMKQEEEERIEEKAIAQRTVPGDVYDTKGNLLCRWNEKSESYEYADNFFYSTILGSADSGLLLDTQSVILHSLDGDCNKADSLILTLDGELQKLLCRILEEGQGERRSAVILDAKTGAILAMADYPTYDITAAEKPAKEAIVSPLHWPVRPGSIYKVINAIAIIENHMEDEELVDEGFVKLGNATIYNDGVKARIEAGETITPHVRNLASAIEYSSNVYFGTMAYRLGWTVIEDVANRLLIGRQGISMDFCKMNSTFESSLEPYDRSAPNQQLAQIGYGLSGLQITPLHAAMITQGIANDGQMYLPHMVKEVQKSTGLPLDEDNCIYKLAGPVNKEIPGQTSEAIYAMAPETAQKIREDMKAGYRHTKMAYELSHEPIAALNDEGVVVDGKTYSIAAKTGTADLVGSNNAWMITMAPAEDPQYVVVIMREKVPEKTYGNSTLVDIVKIYEALFSAVE